MNIHLYHDDKFVDDFIHTCAHSSVAEEQRHYVLGVPPFRHVRHPEARPLRRAQDLKTLIGGWEGCERVFFHYLDGKDKLWLATHLPPHLSAIWCFWGGEALGRPDMPPIHGPKSAAYAARSPWLRMANFWNKPADALMALYELVYKNRHKRAAQLRAFRRMDAFAHFIPADHACICDSLGLNLSYVPFHYASIEALLGCERADAQAPRAAQGPHLWLGNSDTPSNNHFEAIDRLAGLPLAGRQVFCPLSYERGAYARAVARYGEQRLGEAFVPMLDFLPKAEYNQRLASAAYLIMPHWRSQAAGNIMVGLWQGAKVFMSARSSLYGHLRGLGMVVFSLEEALDAEALSPLADADVAANREALLAHFAAEQQAAKFEYLLRWEKTS